MLQESPVALRPSLFLLLALIAFIFDNEEDFNLHFQINTSVLFE